MPSPFPGMDPWLEDSEVFPNLHACLITHLQEAINAVLPPGYVATTKTIVWVDDELRREPDVSLFGRDREPNSHATSTMTLTGLVAIGQAKTSDPWEEPYLEILSTKGKRLVTAVEVLSPSNKRAGDTGRKMYQEKQKEIRLAGVNLVEIDLLRGGSHSTILSLMQLQKAIGQFDYHISVLVGHSMTYHAAAIRLTDRLPTIGIPLDPEIPEVKIDLQPLLDRCYDGGRYTELVNYRHPCDPPLTPEQQMWAEGILRARGLIA
jgi:Protein of unknown function (DUF4058)